MNPAQLLAHFDRISDAPDAIPRLRQFILDLAVRGKLVEQDLRGEPASEPLKRIEDDVRKRKAHSEFIESPNAIDTAIKSLPFNVPSSWTWTRLIEIAEVSYGFAFESSRFNSNKIGMPLIRIRDISGTDTQAYYQGEHDPAYVVSKGDYLVGMDGDFNVRKWKGPAALLNQRVMRIKKWRAELVAEFLAIPLQMILDHLHVSTSQTTVKHLSVKQVNGIYLPIPPLAEQHRIVAKVDELMALCDRLETAQTEREGRRDQLVASSLNRLNNGADADAFCDHVRFYFNHLPRLTTKPEHIQQLRQTILNLAVRGKLVPQDPNDEPASTLWERMVNLTAEGETVTEPLRLLSVDVLPFDLPFNWVWAQAQNLCRPSNLITYGILKPVWVDTGVPTVRVQDMQNGRIVVENVGQCSSERAGKFAKTRLETGDLLIAKDGATLGKTAFVPRSLAGGNITQHVLRFPIIHDVASTFVRLVVDSPHGQAWMRNETKGVALPGVNVADFRRMPIPLPPLAEQQRIVAKVDELMALCDRLEAQLTTTHTDSRRLLEAVLHEVLATAV